MLLIRYCHRAGLLIAGFAAIVSLSGVAPALAAKPAPNAAKPVVVQAAENYVGQDTCLTCHEQQDYQGTLHALKMNDRSPAATHGCESCHGGGKAHVDGGGDVSQIVNPKKLRAQEASEICAGCHNRGLHALWSGSQHDQRDVGCTSCHSVHAPAGDKQLKAKSEFELCAKCHRNITNKQQRFNHMPVREGKLLCTACHNIHGSANVKLLKVGTTANEACTSCHAEKRGPVLWEHPPVVENCATCHDPHGTNNDRMLVAKVPFLCQRCHVTSRHPPTVYEGLTLRTSQSSNKIASRGCAICHQMIHGSNAPTGKAYLR